MIAEAMEAWDKTKYPEDMLSVFGPVVLRIISVQAHSNRETEATAISTSAPQPAPSRLSHSRATGPRPKKYAAEYPHCVGYAPTYHHSHHEKYRRPVVGCMRDGRWPMVNIEKTVLHFRKVSLT